MACSKETQIGWRFITFVCVFFLVNVCGGGLLVRMGKRPPQSVPYLVSLLIRRIMLPLVDVAFDWIAVAAYWRDGYFEEAGAILAFLVLGTLSLMIVSAFSGSDAHAYPNLQTVKYQGPQGIACGCLAGLFQVGPLYLGGLAIRSWREVTDTRWRTPAGGRTSQAALNDYVALVAEVKHFIHFEALFEGGPQLILQTILIARNWEGPLGLRCVMLTHDMTCIHAPQPPPPYYTYGLRVPASCVLYVPEAQGSLLPGRALRGTELFIGRRRASPRRPPRRPLWVF